MQSSDQSPEEKQPLIDQPPVAGYSTSEASVDAPIAGTHEQGQLNIATPEKTAATEDSEAIRQGQIYPPPPSFYEKALAQSSSPDAPWTPAERPASPSMPPARPAVPPEWQRQPMPPDYGPGYQQPPAGHQMPPPGYPAYPQGQQYPGVQAPPFVPGPPPVKQSRKWTWILISVLAVVLLASCGLCAWAGSSFIGNTYSQAYNAVINGNQLISDYYSAVQNKQYTQAYNYLSLPNTSRDQFIAQASRQDELYGPLLRYTPGQPQITNYDGSNLDSFSINVDISRQKKSYTAHLKLKLINNQWKIISYDQL
ncbi:hypothetical protein [Dictyobacter kobayashii]|uniref:DUF4878 domain-containing protein n=1 Tax=Dictyobacter kobayashii TaxID=2014872 RepID=A0A402AJS7_9CHLR|nr:hypothetical protein [Dictyobacter kobayashii]GCE19314.1 hypothetical protein KDK_31140 [Dictyobacter kobayashii]